MTPLPRSLLRAIGEAVQDAGGDMDDVEDMVDVWTRLDADMDRCASRLLFNAQHPRCCCSTPADPDELGRCSRCYGEVER
jgi:hypothetical protein